MNPQSPPIFTSSVTLHSGFVLVEGGVTLLNVKYDWFEESVNHTVTASFERTLRRWRKAAFYPGVPLQITNLNKLNYPLIKKFSFKIITS